MAADVFRIGVASHAGFRRTPFEEEPVVAPVTVVAEDAAALYDRRMGETHGHEFAFPVAPKTDIHFGAFQESDLIGRVSVVARRARLFAERAMSARVFQGAAGLLVTLETDVRLAIQQHSLDPGSVRRVAHAALSLAERAVLGLFRVLRVQRPRVASIAEGLLGEVENHPVAFRSVAVLAQSAGHRGVDVVADQGRPSGSVRIMARGTLQFGDIETPMGSGQLLRGIRMASVAAHFPGRGLEEVFLAGGMGVVARLAFPGGKGGMLRGPVLLFFLLQVT